MYISDRRIDWLTKVGPNFENYMCTWTINNYESYKTNRDYDWFK